MTNVTGGLTVRVAAKTVEAVDICSFELVDTSGKVLPAFSAGSHIDVAVGEGLTRQYSLCNDPAESHRYQIAVLRDPATRGGSAGMHDHVRVGDVIAISAPKNHFPLAHEAKKSLLLAGGIGVTPILCMAERLALTGADFEMHYCTRSKDRTAFHDRIRNARYASRVQFHFDDGDVSQKFDIAARLATPEAGTHLYVCGPKGFMDAVLATARARGWPEAQLHYEFFSADVTPSANDESFEVQLASSGRVVVVPKDKTVVQALADAGIEVQTSCEQGVCGTCITRVLEGEPDHKDLYFTPEEQAKNDQFTPCCSRAKSKRLVLDL
jgi:vanillate O-demethylase ferredoxin subunit